MTTEQDRANAKRALLSLLSSASPQPVELDRGGWDALRHIAQQHLLAPLLYHQIRENGHTASIPEAIWQFLSEEYRATAIRALLLQSTLHRIDTVLQAHGIVYAALKGSRLASHAYPHAALRPMRDIDILVGPDEAVRAQRLLLENGFRRFANENRPDDLVLQYHKHLAPLEDAEAGTRVEIHARLFETGLTGNQDATLMQADALLSRRVVQTLPHMAPSVLPAEEALAHCVVHAMYDSRFTCGPIVLSDVRYLLASEDVDWPRFWALVDEGGWTAGAALAFRLAEKLHGSQPIEWSACSHQSVPEGIVDSFALALMADLSGKRDLFIQTDAEARGTRASLSHISGLLIPAKHQLKDFGRTASDSPLVWLYYPAWLVSRLIRHIASRANRRLQSDIAAVGEVAGWLHSKGG